MCICLRFDCDLVICTLVLIVWLFLGLCLWFKWLCLYVVVTIGFLVYLVCIVYLVSSVVRYLVGLLT